MIAAISLKEKAHLSADWLARLRPSSRWTREGVLVCRGCVAKCRYGGRMEEPLRHSCDSCDIIAAVAAALPCPARLLNGVMLPRWALARRSEACRTG
jgi:hypothetical protein